ncbi:MAG: NAD-dependent epimerase/dehydratase family protein [Byssovorax sp.]
MSRAVLVLGGGGFIGSHVAERFHREGDRVVVLDGLVPGTGGRAENLAALPPEIRQICARIEDAPDLDALLDEAEVIVDSMAWTAHHLALESPRRDLDLNAASHLALLERMPRAAHKTVIFLGSRGQYGNPKAPVITEETPMVPEDVQGIHKLAAESYFRVYAKRGGFGATSLRFGNCFGPHQPREGRDIGLIGGFVRDLLAGKTVEVYGGGRTRFIVYAPDVAAVVHRLSRLVSPGFCAYNHAGHHVAIETLVRMIQEIVGRGDVRIAPMPDEVRRLDIGEARFSEDRLAAALGEVPRTNLRAALEATARDFTRG